MRLARTILSTALLLLSAMPAATAGAESPPMLVDSVRAQPSAVAPRATAMTLFLSYEAAVSVQGERLAVGTIYPDSAHLESAVNGLGTLAAVSRGERGVTTSGARSSCTNAFCIDSNYVRDEVPADSGWTVIDEAPNVTLSPSVNIGGGWHGYIRDGVISEDVEHRSFGYPRRR